MSVCAFIFGDISQCHGHTIDIHVPEMSTERRWDFCRPLFLLRLLRFILDQLQQLEWGLLVVDEVQVMPARTFRSMTAWHVLMESAPKDSEHLDFRRNQE